jgi:predicted RND superfamily exporter protein
MFNTKKIKEMENDIKELRLYISSLNSMLERSKGIIDGSASVARKSYIETQRLEDKVDDLFEYLKLEHSAGCNSCDNRSSVRKKK